MATRGVTEQRVKKVVQKIKIQEERQKEKAQKEA
jgi:hypothetical protein